MNDTSTESWTDDIAGVQNCLRRMLFPPLSSPPPLSALKRWSPRANRHPTTRRAAPPYPSLHINCHAPLRPLTQPPPRCSKRSMHTTIRERNMIANKDPASSPAQSPKSNPAPNAPSAPKSSKNIQSSNPTSKTYCQRKSNWSS
jgi:hypothetical protein